MSDKKGAVEAADDVEVSWKFLKVWASGTVGENQTKPLRRYRLVRRKLAALAAETPGGS